MLKGANIYTVEGLVFAAIGVAWWETFASVVSSNVPLNTFAFCSIAVAAVANLGLSTLPKGETVQRLFMSVVMGITASYIYVVCQVLSGQSLMSNPVTQFYLGTGVTQSVLPVVGLAGSLALLVIQTLVAAAAVSPNIWQSPGTGSIVVISVLLTSNIRVCALWAIGALVLVSLGVILTCQGDKKITRDNEGQVIICIIYLIFQVIELAVMGVLGAVLCLWNFEHITPFVGAVALIGIPFLAGVFRLIAAGIALFEAFNPAELTTTPSVLPGGDPPAAGTAQITVGTLFQTAFHSTEANLFRPSAKTAAWAPKKTS